MLEIPSLPLKYSELQNDRRLGIRFRYVSVLKIACVQTITKLWLVNQSLISSARRLSYKESKKTTVQGQGPTPGNCLRE